MACMAGTIFAAACAFVSCAGNGANKDDGGEKVETETIKGHVRTVSFLPVSEKIYYDGKEVGESNADGAFEISVPCGETLTCAANLSLEDNSFVTVQYDRSGTTFIIIKTNKNMTPNDFYMLSGKVVKQFAEGDEVVGGETVAAGTVMKIDGNPVLTFSDDRNFGVGPVYKESVISLQNGDKTFITASEIPFNNVTYAQIIEMAQATPETMEVSFNGIVHSIAALNGVTFRLNNKPA